MTGVLYGLAAVNLVAAALVWRVAIVARPWRARPWRPLP